MILKLSSPSWAQDVIEEPTIVITFDDTVNTKDVDFDSLHLDWHHTDFSINVKRNKRHRTAKLSFRNGGTSTTICVYHSKDFNKHRSDKNLQDFTLIEDNKFGDLFARLIIDLTSLHDGNYIATYISCSFNAVINISLVTE